MAIKKMSWASVFLAGAAAAAIAAAPVAAAEAGPGGASGCIPYVGCASVG